MLLKPSSLAFFIYLASMTVSSPLAAQPFQSNGTNSTIVQPVNTTGNCSSVAEPDFTAQLSITEKAAILSNGAAIIQSVAATIAAIASTIKDASDNKSCAVISGNINGVQYQYSASGRNCNTTSQEKTIKAAVDRAITFMKNQNVDAACFQLTHGGTWKGLLQIATGGERIVNNKCLGISFPINV